MFWFSLFLVPVITLLFDVCYRAIRTTVYTSEADKIRIAEIMERDPAVYVEGSKRSPGEQSSLLKNWKNTFSRTKKRQKELDDVEMNAR